MKMWRRPYRRVFTNDAVSWVFSQYIHEQFTQTFIGPFYSFDILKTYEESIYEIFEDVSEIFNKPAFDYDIKKATTSITELCQAKSPEEYILFLKGFSRILKLTKNIDNAVNLYNEVKDE